MILRSFFLPSVILLITSICFAGKVSTIVVHQKTKSKVNGQMQVTRGQMLISPLGIVLQKNKKKEVVYLRKDNKVYFRAGDRFVPAEKIFYNMKMDMPVISHSKVGKKKKISKKPCAVYNVKVNNTKAGQNCVVSFFRNGFISSGKRGGRRILCSIGRGHGRGEIQSIAWRTIKRFGVGILSSL